MANIRIGGQAVVNGVTMRSDHYVCTAVRKNNGKIKIKTRKFSSITDKNKFFGFPFVRGIISLVEMISFGIKEIHWSTNQSLNKKDEKIKTSELAIALLISLVVALVIFKFIPWLTANILTNAFKNSYFLLNVMDGAIKIILISLYLYLISKTKDIDVLFRYHGSEHKAVSCFESKKKLTPKNAAKFTTIHPRCGTTFVILVFVLSILFYLLIPSGFSFWFNLLIRILLLPIIAGFAFELIRLSGKYYYKNKLVRIMMWPGLQFQKLTTKEPDLNQLEVAIAALNGCIKKEKS